MCHPAVAFAVVLLSGALVAAAVPIQSLDSGEARIVAVRPDLGASVGLVGVDPCGEQAKLRPPDRAVQEEFAYTVSIFGDTAVVGAYTNGDPRAPDAGAAYVYERSGGVWTFAQRLLAWDGAANDWFGGSVSISGSTIVVGATRDDNVNGTDAGATYIYERSAGVWTERQKLVASDGAAVAGFGYSVSVDGDTLVASSSFGVQSGAAYVYERSAGVWTAQQKLTPPGNPRGDFFGCSASISGDTIVVGARGDDNAGGVNAGSAYVYLRSGGLWTEQGKLVAADAATRDQFGWCVSISGDSVMVGVPVDDNAGGVDAGAAYVYLRSGGVWTEQQKLVASDPADQDQFGRGVSISGDTAVAGAMFDDNAGGVDAGSAYVYVRSAGAWTEQQKLMASDPADQDRLGVSVSVFLHEVMVGSANADNELGPDAGAAYVFACYADVTPTCEAGPDVVQQCDGVQLHGMASDPNGDALTIEWTTTCEGATFWPSAQVLDPVVTFGSDCNVSCDLLLTADDGSGNICIDALHVNVDDTTPPSVAGPGPVTVECFTDVPPTDLSAVTASDNCDPAVIITHVGDISNRRRCPETITRTYRATDACGNFMDCRQVITVDDVTAPILGDTPSDATVECDAVPAPATPTAADNCDPAPRIHLAELRADGGCTDTYTLTRTWTAVDSCGNLSPSQSQVLTVQDTTAPMLTSVPSDVTVECDAVPTPATATAADNCDPAPRIAFAELRTDGSCPQAYVLRRTWTATDQCDNTSSLTQVITVQDAVAPTLVGVPADTTVECDAVPPPAAPSATDACDPAPHITYVQRRIDGPCPGSYTLRRTWTATDACNNASSRVQQVDVRDTTPPTFARSGHQFETSLWPPNHGYVVFEVRDVATAVDACGAVTVAVTGCASNQPEDAPDPRSAHDGNGDAHTTQDCVLSQDGTRFAVRAERMGSCGADSARTYTIELTAIDECGNSAMSDGVVTVDHDGSADGTNKGRSLHPNEPPPFPVSHPTTYARGCR